MTYNEAMDAARERDANVSSASMSRGWYVYYAGGGFWAHNPYHGEGRSGRDHQFIGNERDMRATWWVVK
jgi:hypothetical protein